LNAALLDSRRVSAELRPSRAAAGERAGARRRPRSRPERYDPRTWAAAPDRTA